SSNGPPLTSGWSPTGTFAKVRRPFPSPVAYCDQTCSGRIERPWSSGSTFAAGTEYRTTSVLKVNAASFAVSGWPSDHVAFGAVSNVHVSPSDDVFQDDAKSGRKSDI